MRGQYNSLLKYAHIYSSQNKRSLSCISTQYYLSFYIPYFIISFATHSDIKNKSQNYCHKYIGFLNGCLSILPWIIDKNAKALKCSLNFDGWGSFVQEYQIKDIFHPKHLVQNNSNANKSFLQECSNKRW